MNTNNDSIKKAMLEALSKSLGNISTAAQTVGISRSSHYKWINEDPEYKSEYEKLSDQALDYVESKLFELISGANREVMTAEGVKTLKDAPNATAIIFYLKTRGKARGYVEKMELLDSQTQPVQIIVKSNL